MPLSASLRTEFVVARSPPVLVMPVFVDVDGCIAGAGFAVVGIVFAAWVAAGSNHELSASMLRSPAVGVPAKTTLAQTADKAIAATERIVDFIKVSRGIDKVAPSSLGARIKPYAGNWQTGFADW